VKAAKLEDFSWHCLRRTFISRLAMAGVDLRTVQELTGHKNSGMACRYAHLAPSHQQAALEKLVGSERGNRQAPPQLHQTIERTAYGLSNFITSTATCQKWWPLWRYSLASCATMPGSEGPGYTFATLVSVGRCDYTQNPPLG